MEGNVSNQMKLVATREEVWLEVHPRTDDNSTHAPSIKVVKDRKCRRQQNPIITNRVSVLVAVVSNFFTRASPRFASSLGGMMPSGAGPGAANPNAVGAGAPAEASFPPPKIAPNTPAAAAPTLARAPGAGAGASAGAGDPNGPCGCGGIW
jgi:hypothetical protein